MIAELRIADDHPAFPGHFPGLPILPGAALLDEAVYEIARSRNLDMTGWRVTAKFHEIVRPGDVLTLEHSTGTATTIRFTVRSPGTAVASGMLTRFASAAGSADGL